MLFCSYLYMEQVDIDKGNEHQHIHSFKILGKKVCKYMKYQDITKILLILDDVHPFSLNTALARQMNVSKSNSRSSQPEPAQIRDEI